MTAAAATGEAPIERTARTASVELDRRMRPAGLVGDFDIAASPVAASVLPLAGRVPCGRMEGSTGVARIEHLGHAVVIHPRFDPVPRPFESLSDDDWDRAWEQPMREVILAMADAHRSGVRRIVVVVPTTAMSGGAQHAHVAAPAEAIRVLVKSAARQWGADGVTVNAVAVSPERVLARPELAGPVSIAPPALEGHDDPSAVIAFLASDAAGDVTGQTITVDGGRWM